MLQAILIQLLLVLCSFMENWYYAVELKCSLSVQGVSCYSLVTCGVYASIRYAFMTSVSLPSK